MNKKTFDEVVNLAHFLEKYSEKAHSSRNITFKFEETDMQSWQYFYTTLIEPGILPDGTAFGSTDSKTKLGIGDDGTCYGDEFFQLLMQCYKYLYYALSAGEVFLEHTGWEIAEKNNEVQESWAKNK